MVSVRELARATVVTLTMVLVAVALVGLVYAETPSGPDEDPENFAPSVLVSETETGYLLAHGLVTDDTVGVVFYPGARVASESYLPHLAPLAAERDIVVVVPEMPLNFAIFDIDAADEAMASQPDIERWYVGGHSLGGAMACEYADDERIEGLVLFASYCASDLSGAGIRGLSVLGTADGVIDAERERESRANLPPSTEVVEIEGMNHAQFGAYGPQRGDSDPEISDDEARERLSTVLVEWFEPVTEPR